eukprot:1962144-Alexandrium_andersonii.AAC.1
MQTRVRRSELELHGPISGLKFAPQNSPKLPRAALCAVSMLIPNLTTKRAPLEVPRRFRGGSAAVPK